MMVIVSQDAISRHWTLTFNEGHSRDGPHLLSWDRDCTKCGCRLLSQEADGWCCRKGRWRLPPLRPYPAEVERGIRQVEATINVSAISRRLNNLFAMTAIGVQGSFMQLPMPSNVVITGRTYHRILDLKSGQHSLRWFLYDEAARRERAIEQAVPLSLVSIWRECLLRDNHYVRCIQAAKEDVGDAAFEVRVNGHIAGNEMAAVFNTVNMQTVEPRRVVFKAYANNEHQFMSIFSSLYEPLQYPILFPYGELGWSPRNREGLTQCQWYRRRILMEVRFRQYSRLTQEYMVDMYSRVEEERIFNIKRGKQNQQLRFNVNDGDVWAGEDSWHSQLPASFMGSRAWASNQVADALTLCRTFGKPTLFITMTTNPQWQEITSQLLPKQNASDIPQVVVRVFHQKMRRMIQVLAKASGGFQYMIWVVEFQKRGLPHCHVLVKLKAALSIAETEALVRAELPSEEEDPQLRALILKHNMHSKAHLSGPYSRCNKKGRCVYGFPIPLQVTTSFNEFGHILLRRRKEEDRWVVSHIPGLLRELQTHIHVDVCSHVGVVMYLYKYLFKGVDKAKMGLMSLDGDGSGDAIPATTEFDDYVNSRYLSSSEAIWRIFNYNVTAKKPSVMVLKVHMPNAQLGSMMSTGIKASTGSPLLYYFARPTRQEFDGLRFTEYFAQFKRTRTLSHAQREQRHWLEQQVLNNPQLPCYVIRRKGVKGLMRLAIIAPRLGEVYYLRLLLQMRPSRSFNELKTVNGVLYETFQEACADLGLFRDKNEVDHVMEEAIAMHYSPQHLRFLLAQLLVDLEPAGRVLWDRYKHSMLADFANISSIEGREREALCDLQRLLQERNATLSHFGLPEQGVSLTALTRELDILQCEADEQRQQYERRAALFNGEQQAVFNTLVARQKASEPSCVFLDGRAGRGKSFVLEAFVCWCRSQQWVVLIAGSTALSVLPYTRGRTAHSTFSVPIDHVYKPSSFRCMVE
jgi:hypothetical protein